MPSSPTFHVVLVEPEIPHNTGAIARLCVALRCRLHLVGRLGFRIDDRAVRRAGLDYWAHVDLRQHLTLDELFAEVAPESAEDMTGSDARPAAYAYSVRGDRDHYSVSYRRGDVLLFGSETRGLPTSALARATVRCRIPMLDDRVRSLNLATSAAAVMYEGWRQVLSTPEEPRPVETAASDVPGKPELEPAVDPLAVLSDGGRAGQGGD